MNEQELVAQLKTLKSIQPDKKWVLSVKTQILSQAQKPFVPTYGRFGWLRGRAFLLAPSLVLILVLGIFVYNNMVSLQTASENAEALEAMAGNLILVQSNLLETAAGLEKVKEPDKVMKVKENLDSALKNGQRLVAAARETVGESKKEISPDVLAAIVNVEQALEQVEQVYSQKQKQMAENLIEDLENRSLLENQKALLEQAKEYYEQSLFDEALIKLLEI